MSGLGSCGRSRQKANTASCGMYSSRGTLLYIRTKAPRACTLSCLESIRAFRSESKHGIMQHVQLTRNSLVHTDKSSPCMHSVWLGVDSGVPVRKQTRHHVPICTSSLLAFSCLKFSSRVNLDLQASRIFRPTPHTKIWSNFVRAPRWWCARRWLTVDTEDNTSARCARGGGAPGGG